MRMLDRERKRGREPNGDGEKVNVREKTGMRSYYENKRKRKFKEKDTS